MDRRKRLTLPLSVIGFSLTEILIALTIVSVVVAFCIPAFTKARQAARTTKAIGNMRQIYLGLLTYQQDFSRLPPCPAVAGQDSWNQLIAPYVEPSFQRPTGSAPQLPSVFYDSAVKSNNLRGDFGVLVDQNRGPFSKELSLSTRQIIQLARTPLVLTTEQKNANGETVGSFFVQNYSSPSGESDTAPHISERHNSKALVVFGDGSAIAATKKALFDDGFLPFVNR